MANLLILDYIIKPCPGMQRYEIKNTAFYFPNKAIIRKEYQGKIKNRGSARKRGRDICPLGLVVYQIQCPAVFFTENPAQIQSQTEMRGTGVIIP